MQMLIIILWQYWKKKSDKIKSKPSTFMLRVDSDIV